MVELAFRAYNEGANIIGVAFPADGGDAVLREAIPVSAVGLEVTGSPPHQLDMPFETYRVKSRKALERGGLELVVDYEGERISITPLTHVGTRLEDRTVRYTFADFCVEDQRDSEIQNAKSEARFRITADELPLSDETWP